MEQATSQHQEAARTEALRGAERMALGLLDAIEEAQFIKAGRKIIGVLFVLAVTQIIGWGTVSLLAIIGRQVATDLDMDISAVFAGSSILYLPHACTSVKCQAMEVQCRRH